MEWIYYVSFPVRFDSEVRINIKTPSKTAQPIAELKILRDMRKEAPSKKPIGPRCCEADVRSINQLIEVTCGTHHPDGAYGRCETLIPSLAAYLYLGLQII